MLPNKILSKVLLALAALAVSSTVAAPSGDLFTRQSGGKTLSAPSVIPSVFQLLGPATDALPLTFTMHLDSADMPGLATFLDNNAKTLGNPLSQEDLAKYATPSASTLTAVASFLKANGFQDSDISYSTYKDAVTVNSNVGQVSKLFNADFQSYKINKATVPRTKQYTIPASIANGVSLVEPLVSFAYIPNAGPIKHTAASSASPSASGAPASCDTKAVTPACLRALYGTDKYTPTPAKGKSDVFIAGFINQNFAQSSLTRFLKKYRADAASYKMPVINTAGAINVPLLPGDEAMLDTETIVAATYPLNSTFYNYGTMATQGDIFQLAFADILNKYDYYGQPGVYSVSYGADESSITQDQANLMCNTAMKLTSRGMTIVLASGDNGVGGSQGDKCPPFVPTYPSGCQYITSVGATQRFSPEEAVDPSLGGFYSGSGFSNLFPTASFQQSAVSTYESGLGSQDAGDYNKTGRGYPDVSAQGSQYVIVATLEENVSGTSASAPTFASIVALLNDARRKNGKGNIGWFNPKAYSNSNGFTDVTKGNSSGCGSTSLNFPTAKGWDPSTGLGTPLFQQLQTIYA